MKPAIFMILAWLLFGGSHILLSGTPIRGVLIKKLGPRGFTLVFTAVTAASMLVLCAVAAIYGGEGAPGFGLKSHVFMLCVLQGFSVLGAVLMAAGLINYPRSPMAYLVQRQRDIIAAKTVVLAPPTAIERFVRHPFFTGLFVMMCAHTLLASTLASMVYFAGFAVLAAVGIPLQDRKLRQRWQSVYAAFEASTSNIPTAAPAAQRAIPEWGRWIAAILVAIVFFGVCHPIWTYANGALFAGFVLLFGVLGVLKGLAASTRS